MELQRLYGDFSVCKVEDASRVNFGAAYCFLGKTDEETSLVCLTADVPPGTVEREDGWAAFRVRGTLDFSLVGILAGIASVLAERGVPIFAISTYNTDYILLKREREPEALEALARAGYEPVEEESR